MNRHVCFCGVLVLIFAGLTGCSSEPAKSNKPSAPLDKIQGTSQIVRNETSAQDEALNAGGPSVYLLQGLQRYRLFFNKAIDVEPGKEYIAEGIYAQKAIDAIGDPDQGKNGYPLSSSCDQVIRTTWPGLPFDLTDADSTALCAKVKRYPARAVFLVVRLTPAPAGAGSEAAKKEEKEVPEVSVPADKERALLISGPTVQPAPLWQPDGGTANCKVVINQEGKIDELDSGSQLCESVPWSQFRYQPPIKGGHPVKVDTEVAVRFDPRK